MRRSLPLAGGLVIGLVGLVACRAAPSSAPEGVRAGVPEGTDPRTIGGSPSSVAEDATVLISLHDDPTGMQLFPGARALHEGHHHRCRHGHRIRRRRRQRRMTDGRYKRGGITIFAVGPASYTYPTNKGSSIPVSVAPGEFLSNEPRCFGDSGGPLYDAAGFVIGVTSPGIDDLCIDRPSVWSDVFSHATLIQDAAATAGIRCP